MSGSYLKDEEQRYQSWSVAELLQATTVEKQDYEPEALDAMLRELSRRSVSQSERESIEKEVFQQTVEKQSKADIRKFRWGKFVGLFVIFLVLLSFYAPKNARVILMDQGPGSSPTGEIILDESEATYLQPFWGTDIETQEIEPMGGFTKSKYLFNSFRKSVVLKGRFPSMDPWENPKIVPGRTYMTGTTTLRGRSSLFASELWLLFYILPSLILSFLFTDEKPIQSLKEILQKFKRD